MALSVFILGGQLTRRRPRLGMSFQLVGSLLALIRLPLFFRPLYYHCSVFAFPLIVFLSFWICFSHIFFLFFIFILNVVPKKKDMTASSPRGLHATLSRSRVSLFFCLDPSSPTYT